MNAYQIIVLAVFIIMTAVGYVLMAIDKKRAKKGEWRIKEATLFLVAFLFGGVGTILGMYVCRHKTNHWYFEVFMPIFAIISIAATVLLIIAVK